MLLKNILHTQVKSIKPIFLHEANYAGDKLFPSALDCDHLGIFFTSFSPTTLENIYITKKFIIKNILKFTNCNHKFLVRMLLFKSREIPESSLIDVQLK